MEPSPRPSSRSQPVVLAGLGPNAKSVACHLSSLGYEVSIVSPRSGGRELATRHGTRASCPDPASDLEGWVAFMLSFSRRFAEPPPLLVMTDDFVAALDRSAERLVGDYRVAGFGAGLRTALMSKRSAFELAARHRFPHSQTRFVRNRDDLAAFAEEIEGPILLKPEFSTDWRKGSAAKLLSRQKVVHAADVEGILSQYERIAPFTPGVLAQEVVPGPDRNLVYWCGFAGPAGRCGSSLLGRKLRTYPIHFGSATFVQLVDLPRIDSLCREFLTRLGYEGLCGIELKEDPRDGVFKLIEINPRYSLWEDIGIPVGIDLAREAVESLLGRSMPRREPLSFEQKWLWLARDIRAFRDYRRQGLLSTSEWLRTLAPPVRLSDLRQTPDPRLVLDVARERLAKGPLGTSG